MRLSAYGRFVHGSSSGRFVHGTSGITLHPNLQEPYLQMNHLPEKHEKQIKLFSSKNKKC